MLAALPGRPLVCGRSAIERPPCRVALRAGGQSQPCLMRPAGTFLLLGADRTFFRLDRLADGPKLGHGIEVFPIGHARGGSMTYETPKVSDYGDLAEMT